MPDDPKSMGDIEFRRHRFYEISVGELFWLNEIPRDNNKNPSYRKVGENEGLNVITRELINFDQSDTIYQKEW